MITQTIHMKQQHWIKFLVVINFLVLSLLTGCTTAGNAIPKGGPTMAQVYEEAMQKSNGGTIEQVREKINNPISVECNNHQSDFTRTSENEINNLFPTLANPQIVMYVYPHVTGIDETPVPGYGTVFPLYDKVHYSMLA